jgi:hypothetical protein
VQEGGFQPVLVNRIDRFTGGIVIIAKSEAAMHILNQKIRDREIEKRYLCIVHGRMHPANGMLDNYISKSDSAKSPWTDYDTGGKLSENRRHLEERRHYAANLRRKYDHTDLQHKEHHFLDSWKPKVRIGRIISVSTACIYAHCHHDGSKCQPYFFVFHRCIYYCCF